jgi:hypothetical protein
MNGWAMLEHTQRIKGVWRSDSARIFSRAVLLASDKQEEAEDNGKEDK